MKFLTQIVLPILLVVGLIGGVTFVSHYSGTRKSSKKIERPSEAAVFELNPLVKSGEAVVLKNNEGMAEWSKLNSKRVPEFELYDKHYYDFSLHNLGPTALTVGLNKKNCTCANVQMTLLSAAEAEQAAREDPKWAKTLGDGDRWQELDAGGAKSVAVPAGDWGLIRMNWQGRQLGQQGLKAQLWIDRGSSGREEPILLVPVNIVAPIQVPPVPLIVPDLTARGGEQKVEFPCWSATRASFPLTIREDSPSPCVVWKSKAMDARQCEELARRIGTAVRSGYMVMVTVHEQQGDQQLDLGPYRRRLVLRAGLAENELATVQIEGVVRGDVAFVNTADKDRIDLGPFRASRGTSKTVPLRTEVDGQPLEVDSWTPALLSVKLVSAGGRRWDLTVEVPANRWSGQLPEDSAVILRTRGTGPRRMRIPIVGQATR